MTKVYACLVPKTLTNEQKNESKETLQEFQANQEKFERSGFTTPETSKTIHDLEMGLITDAEEIQTVQVDGKDYGIVFVGCCFDSVHRKMGFHCSNTQLIY